jgi:hypothetical protein
VLWIGAGLGGGIGPVPGEHFCHLLSPWHNVEAYLLVFYFGWSVFTLEFIARHLRLGLLQIGGTLHTRIMLQMVQFILAFTCTWVWYSPKMYQNF